MTQGQMRRASGLAALCTSFGIWQLGVVRGEVK